MQLAGEVYEASVVPRERPQRARKPSSWLHGLTGEQPEAELEPEPVVAAIVVIDLRNGAERVEISVTGAEVTPVLARVHNDLDTLSVDSFDEQWGLL